MRHRPDVVCNQPGDTKSKKRTRTRRLIHRPGHDDIRYLAESANGLSVGQTLVDRNTLERLICEAAKHRPELPLVTN
jgi:hypothetical protein